MAPQCLWSDQDLNITQVKFGPSNQGLRLKQAKLTVSTNGSATHGKHNSLDKLEHDAWLERTDMFNAF